ncbi:MAG TPA: GNAT family N-acetyltransferase [Longimicrobiaceae bacterium]|nr:GNAT family N-acetyltransferase [Longimicrobiaceae bacterium]
MKGPLRTPRLVLDPVRKGDAIVLHAHWTDPEVREFLWDGKVVTRQQVAEVVETSDRLFAEAGAGLWAMRSPAGAFFGCAGFWYFHEPPELELIISLSPSSWGTGLASEAARALVDHAFSALGWDFVQASTDAPNERSLKLIRALGMQPTGQRPGEFGTIEVFRIER